MLFKGIAFEACVSPLFRLPGIKLHNSLLGIPHPVVDTIRDRAVGAHVDVNDSADFDRALLRTCFGKGWLLHVFT